MKHTFLSLLLSSTLAAAFMTMLGLAYGGPLQYIKPEELKQLIDSYDPHILVVDVQPKPAYDLGRIKRAINFPWAADIKSSGSLPRDKTLVLYCDCASEGEPADLFSQAVDKAVTCSSDDDATDVAQQLMTKFGYKDIRILEGGWSKWEQLGYPIER